MYRLANFDVTRSIASPGGRLAAQVTFGAACTGAMVLLRTAIDTVAPTAGPFALVYPPVLLATLYGHWQAGLVTLVGTILWGWYFILPPAGSFDMALDTDPPRVVLNVVAALFIVVFAETFRRAVARAAAERDREIERRRTLLIEIEHRTKNNFALVVSLLEMQKRRDPNPAASAALDEAIGRVNSFARAYASLSGRQGEGPAVDMRPFLLDLVEQVASAGFGPNVTVVTDCQDCELPRETAVAIGLFTNEALTNCAKHAFPGDQAGSVAVSFARQGAGWSLSISDDGVGPTERRSATGEGWGQRLLDAFAQQAGAVYSMSELAPGRRVSLVAS